MNWELCYHVILDTSLNKFSIKLFHYNSLSVPNKDVRYFSYSADLSTFKETVKLHFKVGTAVIESPYCYAIEGDPFVNHCGPDVLRSATLYSQL